MPETMLASVLIPVHNRKEELGRLLISLKDQSFPKDNFEIIIADDGSTDNVHLLAESMNHDFKGNLKCVILKKQSNAAVVRNIAASHARGMLLIFIDSDCITPKDWLINIINYFTVNNKIGCFGGPEKFHEDDSFFVKCCSIALTSVLTTGGIRGREGIKFADYYPHGFNMIVPKKIYDEVGGSNQEVRIGYDIELSCRIKEKGYNSGYADNIGVYHRRRTNIITNVKQLFEFGAGRVFISKNHKQLLEPIYWIPSTILMSFIILIIGSFLSHYVFFLLKIIFSLIILYLSLIGIVSFFRLKDIRAFFVVPFIFVLHQISYALGFIFQFVSLKFKKYDL